MYQASFKPYKPNKVGFFITPFFFFVDREKVMFKSLSNLLKVLARD